MKSYLVNYDLNRPGQQYAGLIQAIKCLGVSEHIQLSVWIVNSHLSAITIRSSLLPYLDANDKLFVVELQREAAWSGLAPGISNWLISNLAA